MYNKLLSITLAIFLVATGYTSNAQYVFERFKLNPNGNTFIYELTPTDSFLYFKAKRGHHDTAPWKSDGTFAGTKRIRSFDGTTNGNIGALLGVINDKVLFTATDFVHGYEPWITDGDSVNTKMIKDIYTGSPHSMPTSTPSSSAIGGAMYFSVDDGPHGQELWVTDGTTVGTRLIKDINPGTKGSQPSQFVAYNGNIYFTASDGTHGSELWVTDGTATGTKMVIDASSGGAHGYINHLMVYNNKLYYTGYLNTQFGLIESDGTATGTKHIKTVNVGFTVRKESNIVIFNGKMYFGGADTTTPINIELWESNGTAVGTKKVKEINTLFGKSSDPRSLTVVGNQLFFVADDGVHNTELWVTDGTTNGTKMVKDISTHKLAGSDPRGLTKYGNKLVFAAEDSNQKHGVYISDGTINGTKELKYFSMPFADFTEYKGSIFFSAFESPTGGYNLWKLTDTTLNNNPPPNSIATTQNDAVSKIKIAPNPAHDKVFITLDKTYKEAQVSITDLTGKTIFKKAIDAAQKNIELALPNVPTGVYLLSLHHKDGVVSERLLIE